MKVTMQEVGKQVSRQVGRQPTSYIACTRQAVKMVSTKQGTSLSRMLYSHRVRENCRELFRPWSEISMWQRWKQLSSSSAMVRVEVILTKNMFGRVRKNGTTENAIYKNVNTMQACVTNCIYIEKIHVDKMQRTLTLTVSCGEDNLAPCYSTVREGH